MRSIVVSVSFFIKIQLVPKLREGNLSDRCARHTSISSPHGMRWRATTDMMVIVLIKINWVSQPRVVVVNDANRAFNARDALSAENQQSRPYRESVGSIDVFVSTVNE